MILCEARGLQLFSVIRGGIGSTRRLGAGLQHTECLNERMDTLPRTGASQEPIGYHRGMKTLGDHLGSIRCSSCLRLQLFGVETFLLFPKCQSNGRDLACQGQTRHLRLHALGQQSRVEIVERSPATAGPGGGALEDLFHLMVVISIQPTNLLGFLGALHLSAHKTVLRAVVGLNAQPTVGPELPLAAKPVRGLHQPRSSGRLESDRRRESGAAVSRPYVSGSRPKTRIVRLAARPAIHPAVDRAAPRGGARRLAESCSTIPLDSAQHRLGCRHKECPSRDTAPSIDSSRASNLCRWSDNCAPTRGVFVVRFPRDRPVAASRCVTSRLASGHPPCRSCCPPLTRHCAADCRLQCAAPVAAADRTARQPRCLLPRSHAARPVDRGETAEYCWLWFR